METKKYRSKEIAVNFKYKSSKLEWYKYYRKLKLDIIFIQTILILWALQ